MFDLSVMPAAPAAELDVARQSPPAEGFRSLLQGLVEGGKSAAATGPEGAIAESPLMAAMAQDDLAESGQGAGDHGDASDTDGAAGAWLPGGVVQPVAAALVTLPGVWSTGVPSPGASSAAPAGSLPLTETVARVSEPAAAPVQLQSGPVVPATDQPAAPAPATPAHDTGAASGADVQSAARGGSNDAAGPALTGAETAVGDAGSDRHAAGQLPATHGRDIAAVATTLSATPKPARAGKNVTENEAEASVVTAASTPRATQAPMAVAQPVPPAAPSGEQAASSASAETVEGPTAVSAPDAAAPAVAAEGQDETPNDRLPSTNAAESGAHTSGAEVAELSQQGSPAPAGETSEAVTLPPARTAERIAEAVERLRNAPPPARMTLELGDVRIAVSLRRGEVHVAVLGGAPPDWSRDLSTALSSRGLSLASRGESADAGGNQGRSGREPQHERPATPLHDPFPARSTRRRDLRGWRL